LSRDEILFAIGDELKLQLEKGQTTRILRALQEHLIRLFGEGRRVVVLIDEAHAMPDETLEEIRLLSNLESNRHKLLQIVLFGQSELDEHLDTLGMRQLRERITQSFQLEPLVRSDIENYIDFRMRAAGYRGPKVFNPGAIKLIANASQGLKRPLGPRKRRCPLLRACLCPRARTRRRSNEAPKPRRSRSRCPPSAGPSPEGALPRPRGGSGARPEIATQSSWLLSIQKNWGCWKTSCFEYRRSCRSVSFSSTA